MKRLFAVAVVLVLMGRALPSHARVLLKPKGGGAMPLRLKALDAEVAIKKQFATTVTRMTFQNEVADRIEADFIYSVPPRSVVTYFAYWYESEKVVARVVEKERAASIYQHITSRMRDPALIELIGKDTFRARIFPIMPNADLRVEIHTVETLASTPEGARYTFALAPEEKGTGTLENLDVRVRIKRDAALLGAGNNLALPVQSETGAWTMRLAQKNFRPTQDLQVGLKWKPQNLRTKLLAAPSGGNDGFFALALTSGRSLNTPRLQISGVKTYDVLPRRLPRLKAGEQITVVGRYRGGGRARVSLSGQPLGGGAFAEGLASTVEFSRTRRDNNPATKFWAAQQIDVLSASAKNRARVVALSQRFTLPSKWTSWLAIPEAERKRYKQEMVQAEAAAKEERRRAESKYFAYLLVREKAEGRAGGKAARRYHARLKRSLRRAGLQDESSAIYANQRERYLQMEVEERDATADLYVAEKSKSNPDARRLARLQKQLRAQATKNGSFATAVRDAQDRRKAQMLRETTREIADALVEGKMHSPEMQRLEKRRRELKGTDDFEYDEMLWRAIYSQANVVAYNIAKEKAAPRPGEKKIAALENDLVTLKKKSGDYLDMSRFLEGARSRVVNNQPFSQKDAREMYLSQNWGQGGDPLISVKAPADAQQVMAILPGGEVKQMVFDATLQLWQARFDVPTYAPEGAFAVEIVIVDSAGTRRRFTLTFNVDVSAPRGEALAQRRDGKWRLEMQGDGDIARVAALLPDGRKVELQRSAQGGNRYFAVVDAPRADDKSQIVTYILTDRAHNRTQISVDMAK